MKQLNLVELKKKNSDEIIKKELINLLEGNFKNINN